VVEEIERQDDQVTVSASTEELRLLVGALNEALNGGYAIPADEWLDLVGQPPERASALLAALGTILER
jgi:hypothetical protein